MEIGNAARESNWSPWNSRSTHLRNSSLIRISIERKILKKSGSNFSFVLKWNSECKICVRMGGWNFNLRNCRRTRWICGLSRRMMSTEENLLEFTSRGSCSRNKSSACSRPIRAEMSLHLSSHWSRALVLQSDDMLTKLTVPNMNNMPTTINY